MTQEALKLALEALEDFSHKACYDNGEGEIGSRVCCEVLSYKAHDESCKVIKAITAIKEALAQPKKEPIAYINVEKRTLEFAKQIFWHTPTVANLDRIPLYTQRTWVGLTDVEIDYLLGITVGENEETHISFARAIESKLKQKNGYAEEKNT